MLRVPACHGPWPVCASCPWGRDSCSLSTAAAVHDDGGRVLKAGSQRTNKDRRHSGILAWAQRRLIFLAHGSRVDLARRPALAMATPRRGITARWEGNGFVLLSPIRRSVFWPRGDLVGAGEGLAAIDATWPADATMLSQAKSQCPPRCQYHTFGFGCFWPRFSSLLQHTYSALLPLDRCMVAV